MTIVASIVAHFGDRVVALTVEFFEESWMIQIFSVTLSSTSFVVDASLIFSKLFQRATWLVHWSQLKREPVDLVSNTSEVMQKIKLLLCPWPHLE